VDVDERRMSLANLVADPVVPVEPGPVDVRLTLPWGSWHDRVVADTASPVRVTLPATVGLPPLRVRVLAEHPERPDSRRFAVTALGNEGLIGEIRDAGGRPIGPLDHADAASLPRWGAYAATADLVFPLNADGAVVLDLAGEPRAEPLSWTREPNWDKLVSSGRLDALSDVEAKQLTNAKWESALLGVAGAYACYARERDVLPVVLSNLRQLDHELPDLPILDAALDRSNGTRRSEAARELEALEASGGVPLFRWGVGMGVLAAEHYDVPALAERYRELEPRLVEVSVWTLWRE
jgi:hypothetical protein